MGIYIICSSRHIPKKKSYVEKRNTGQTKTMFMLYCFFGGVFLVRKEAEHQPKLYCLGVADSSATMWVPMPFDVPGIQQPEACITLLIVFHFLKLKKTTLTAWEKIQKHVTFSAPSLPILNILKIRFVGAITAAVRSWLSRIKSKLYP